MNNGMNKVLLLGNLGTAPELRHTQTGTPVMSFRLATNESWLDKDKTVQERTEWHTVVVFASRGEALSKILQKGSSVLVEGSIRTTSYDKDGVKRFRTEIIARDVFLTMRKAANSDAAPEPASPRARGHEASEGGGYDELPY